MAQDAIAFIRALGHDQVDLLGFSLGGFVAQVIAEEEPGLVRKLILAGTGRLKERTDHRDTSISATAFRNQLKAIHVWGRQHPSDLTVIQQPVLVANGDHDRMVPSSNSADWPGACRMPS